MQDEYLLRQLEQSKRSAQALGFAVMEAGRATIGEKQ